MPSPSIQERLACVSHPSHYLGTEANTVRKNHDAVDVKIALAFPDLYEIGTSHFGIQILYHIINRDPRMLAERVFAVAEDYAAELRKLNAPLTSLESGTPLTGFDIIGFSLLYELNYTNVLAMLDLAGIPFYAARRTAAHPLIIGGGPCTCNPEPVADFFDALVIGDGERVLPALAEAWLVWEKERAGGDLDSTKDPRRSLYERWRQIEGVYLPHFKTGGRPQPVRRAVVSDLSRDDFPDKPVVPFGKPVHDRLRLEVARGCTRGCRFCQAGMIYRPVRERPMTDLLELCHNSMAATGYEDISLLSLSTGDYSCITPLLGELMARYRREQVAVSFPSMRAGTLTAELMALVKSVRKTGFTIAVEAGSQRLRDAINKNITEAAIVDTVSDVFSQGWKLIKLYFMIGLPTETPADIDAIVDLVKKLKTVAKTKSRGGKINVSVATCIPKPHTPFQWLGQEPLEAARAKINYLKTALRMPGVHVKWQDPEVSVIEGLFARGGRELAPVLVTAYENGCRLDGWSDRFDYGKWVTACQAHGIDPDAFNAKARERGAPLPWGHIDMGVRPDYLEKEYQRLLAAETTPDCHLGPCQQCGVCDFKMVKPVAAIKGRQPHLTAPPPAVPSSEQNEGMLPTYEVDYEKRHAARFFGHLEMAKCVIRAVRRAGLPVKYSAGFHPMPKIAFNNPLPVGVESDREHFYITLAAATADVTVFECLNPFLPRGLRITGARRLKNKKAKTPADVRQYQITVPETICLEPGADTFNRAERFPYTRVNNKGRKTDMDLKKAIRQIVLDSPRRVTVALQPDLPVLVRPVDILSGIFGLQPDEIAMSRILKQSDLALKNA